MPITNELKSINRLEEAGFSHDQAKAVVEVVEGGQQNGFDRFVQVLDARLAEMEARLHVEIQNVRIEVQTMRADLLKEQRDQLLKFAAMVTLIVAVIGGVYRFF
jgi:DNA-binding transcriptional MerR regulator